MRALVFCLFLAFDVAPVAQSQIADLTPEDLANGQRLFESQCARCHGIGGTGGEGPPLTRARLRHASDDDAVFSVIRNGIAGTGMPRTWQMNDQEIWQVSGYVRSLGRVAPVPLPGDPQRGRALYEANECGSCHIVNGEGEGLGPELSEIGVMRGPVHLREALVDPGASLPTGGLLPLLPVGYKEYLPVRIVGQDGREVQGMRVNEDTFTIQLRDAQNRFHSFRKQELATLERQPDRSLMPSYRDRLSDAQLDDLIGYLAILRGKP